jgi:hypothetical protein
LADRGDWRYGIDQPAGGTMNAAKLALHGGTGDGIATGNTSLKRLTAATLSVPEKLTQPCIALPGGINAPGHRSGDSTPGQRTPQSKDPGWR